MAALKGLGIVGNGDVTMIPETRREILTGMRHSKCLKCSDRDVEDSILGIAVEMHAYVPSIIPPPSGRIVLGVRTP